MYCWFGVPEGQFLYKLWWGHATIWSSGYDHLFSDSESKGYLQDIRTLLLSLICGMLNYTNMVFFKCHRVKVAWYFYMILWIDKVRKHKSGKNKRKKEGEGGKVGRKKKMSSEARKRLSLIGKEEVRNNIHKSINMCLTHEQSIGNIYLFFSGWLWLEIITTEFSAISSGNQKINRSIQNIILWWSRKICTSVF